MNEMREVINPIMIKWLSPFGWNINKVNIYVDIQSWNTIQNMHDDY